MPDEKFLTDGNTCYTQVSAAELESGKEHNSVLVDGIFKSSATDNEARGTTPIYATPYVTLKTGESIVCSEEFHCSLKNVLQLIDERAYEENKVALEAFYQEWKAVMGKWKFENIGVSDKQ